MQCVRTADGGALSASLSLLWKARAALAAAAVPPLVHAVPLDRLSRWLARGGRAAVPVDDAALASWIDQWLRRAPWPWRYTCLKRGAVMFMLLRRAGRPVRLHVGVRRDPDALRAHAWLVLDGKPYLETDPQRPASYAEIAAFPEAP